MVVLMSHFPTPEVSLRDLVSRHLCLDTWCLSPYHMHIHVKAAFTGWA